MNSQFGGSETRDGAVCPLCRNEKIQEYHRDSVREYLACTHCGLVFVPREYWLDPAAEKAEYDLHTNDPDDAGYRKFLSRLTDPLLARLSPGSRGLDFGCGPGPALAAVMAEAGHGVSLYDLYYFPDRRALAQTYDFITATEVVEHFKDPLAELETLFAGLNPGGWLGIMTKQVSTPEAFKHWHYIRDLTHICFFSPSTFEYLARRFQARLLSVGNDVILFQKHSSGPAGHQHKE